MEGQGIAEGLPRVETVTALYDRVRTALAAGRFPLVYGADCAVLLAGIPALAETCGAAGLVFIDGHEDTTTNYRREIGVPTGKERSVERYGPGPPAK